MEWYLKVLRNYANFNGRARRKEYWMFALIHYIICILLTLLDIYGGTFMLGGLYSLAVLIPSLAVSVRRLHDVGKSGWMVLVLLIPLLGAIYLLVLLVSDSQDGENEYGKNPKEEGYL